MNKKEPSEAIELQPDTKPQTKSNRNIILVMAGFFLLGMALALFLFGGSFLDNFSGEEPADMPQITSPGQGTKASNLAINTLVAGDRAADFSLLDLDGNVVSLHDFAGQPVVINFWATWCAPCRIEMPELQNAYDTYQDQDLVILAVNAQEEEQHVREFFAELGLTFPALLDSDGQVGGAYGAFGLPSTYFVNRSGEVTAVHRGILSEDQIEVYLAQILP